MDKYKEGKCLLINGVFIIYIYFITHELTIYIILWVYIISIIYVVNFLYYILYAARFTVDGMKQV